MLKAIINFFNKSENIKSTEDSHRSHKNRDMKVEPDANFKDLLNDTINLGSISLDNPDFTGESVLSKNQKYILAWLDGDVWNNGFHLGDRKSGKGSVLLLSNEMNYTLLKKVQRPSFGKVSNAGTFIIADITFKRNFNLMQAYKPDQKDCFFEYKVTANIYDQWISDDGCLCAIEACRSDSGDSEMFFLISLKEKEVLFKKKLEIGRFVNNVHFFSNTKISIENEYGEFRYDCQTGRLIDKNKWYANYTQGLKTKIAKKGRYSKKAIAKFHREIGEIYEDIGNKKEAIIHYQKALENDSKVGVKLKLKKLVNSN